MNRYRLALTLGFCVFALAACQRDTPPPAAAPAAAPGQAATPAAVASPAAQRIEADVRALADDAMQGREAGTPGYDRAAAYVAKRFADAGLVPAGDDGDWLQRVPLLKATRVADGAELAVVRNGRRIALRFRDQFLTGLNYHADDHRLEAPAVFVGQGVYAPELGQDDFAGLNLRGRIAVIFPGAPARFDHDRRAYYSAMRVKQQALVERGAIGMVLVHTPEHEADAPWTRTAAAWDRPGMRLRDADGAAIDAFPALRATATVNAASADLIFADGPRPAAALFDAARAGTLKGFALPGTLVLAGRTQRTPAESANVLARLPGGDAARATEHIVYTAHLDHIGVGAPVNGDAIYNGALDNALGVAVLLEAARMLKAEKTPSARGMLFAALTAEEKGLLGADWLATHPPDGMRLIANINLDMPVLLAPSKDVVPVGIEHSSLKPLVETAAKEIGVALSSDPFPENVVFVRSDQFAFIRAGIPAVYLNGGMVSADGERDPKLALRKFLREHYHQPSDDATLPIAYADAERLAALNARIGRLIGDAAEAPRWNPGDFFGERFGKR
jgi:Zn-dependent M28 family amino/carboxypeptidase